MLVVSNILLLVFEIPFFNKVLIIQTLSSNIFFSFFFSSFEQSLKLQKSNIKNVRKVY